jgi:hypothetical protein
MLVMRQTHLRTDKLECNNNICFPIGTILAVQKYHPKLKFSRIFSKFKKKGAVSHKYSPSAVQTVIAMFFHIF